MKVKICFFVLLTLVLGGCGVPREVARRAVLESRIVAVADLQDEAAVREELARQDAAWTKLSADLRRREFLGLWPADADFTAQVDLTAWLVHQQYLLMEEGKDEPEANRQMLETLGRMWESVRAYFN